MFVQCILLSGAEAEATGSPLWPPHTLHLQWPHVPQPAGGAPGREAVRLLHPRHQPAQDTGQEDGCWAGQILFSTTILTILAILQY